MNKFLLAIVVVSLTACNLRKASKNGANFINEDINKKSELLSVINDSLINARYISFKSNVKTEIDKKDLSFKVYTKLVKDSAIWMSISKGVPLAKVLITKDSIKVRNDVNQTILLEDYSYLENILNFDLNFEMIQTMIIGNPYYYYEEEMYKYHEDRPFHLLTTIKKGKLKKIVKDLEEEDDLDSDEELKVLIHGIWFNGQNGKMKHMFIREPMENRKLWLDFSDFKQSGGESMAREILITLKAKSEKKTVIGVNHTKVEIKEDLNLKFKVSDKYERIY